MPDRTDARRGLAGPLFGLAAAALGVAWAFAKTRGFVDDAYISMRYAENWALHGDLVWNPGDRVEGYSNFLWTALLAVATRLGVSTETAARLLGPAFFAGTLLLLSRFLRRVFGRTAEVSGILVVALNWSFVQSTTMGLEAPLQLLLLAWLMDASSRAVAGGGGSRHALETSVAAALGFMTRMDFALLALPFLGWAMLSWRRLARPALIASCARLLLPGLALAVAWLGWKRGFYGSIFPATAAVKLGGVSHGFAVAYLLQGATYVLAFLVLYGLAPLALLGLQEPRRGEGVAAPLLGAGVLWSLYLLLTGGDWMEFRLALPLLLLLVPPGAAALADLPRASRSLWVLFLLGSSFWMYKEYGRHVKLELVQSRSGMAQDDALWAEVGRALARVFPGGMWGSSSVRIATTAAGALPYYSRLWTYDLVGLNTPEVAREGVPHLVEPGHAFHATVDMAERARVNLVIGRPDVIAIDRWSEDPRSGCRLAPRYFFHGAETRKDERGTVLGLPLREGLVVPMWYLTPSLEVDAAVRQGALVRLPCP